MKRMRILMIFILVISLMLLPACVSNKQEVGTENIKKVIENIFKNIDDSEYKEFQNSENVDFLSAETEKELPAWIQERFEANMTETAYENLLGSGLYGMAVLTYTSDKKMQLEDLQMEEKDGYYEFLGQLAIDDGENRQTVKIEGSAQVDEKGLVSYLDISNLFEISEIMKS